MVFNCFTALFIFSTINREFLFLGIDLRYILVILALFLIGRAILNKRKVQFIKNDLYLFLLYGCLFFSYIFILGNKNIVSDELKSLTILHIGNFLSLLVFIIYKNEINEKFILNIYKLSICILILSFFAVLFSIDIPSSMYTGERMISEGIEQVNLFGSMFRIAGFAEDANYAFLFLYTQMLLLLGNKKRWWDYILLIFVIICMAFSFSKTQIIMILPSLAFYILFIKIKVTQRQKNVLISCFVILIMLLPFILYKTNFMASMGTLKTRYSLWKYAFNMLIENHYMPSGLGGFRFYINNVYGGHWIVQSHSTYVELLTEIGVISLFLFYKVFKFNLKSINNIYFLIVVNYLCFAITSETLYLQYFIFVSCVLVNMNYSRNEMREK